MSYQSTLTISRQRAIKRILLIDNIARYKDYKALEARSFESTEDIRSFIDTYKGTETTNLNKWTNKMLEEVMDQPFFRFSMFENYFVKDLE